MGAIIWKSVTNDGTSDVGFKEEPDDIFEPRVDVCNWRIIGKNAYSLSLSGHATRLAADETHRVLFRTCIA